MQFVPSLPQRTPQDFGLTGAVNGPHSNSSWRSKMPSESNKISHALLNQQTLFVGTIPSVCRENIRAQLSTSVNKDDNTSPDSMVDQAAIDHDDPSTDFQNHETSDDNQDDNHDNEDDEDDNNIDGRHRHDNQSNRVADHNNGTMGSCSLVGDVPSMIGPFSNSFTAEVELSHLLREKRCNLNLFKPVFEWAIRSQKRTGFDFATMQIPRAHETVLKEVQRVTQSSTKSPDGFHPVTINWLPDNVPVDVFVRPFEKALDSLLSNPKLMQECNLSLPNVRDPFSFEHDPAVTVISELHHGSWWKDSWTMANIDPSKNELLVPVIFYMDLISLDTHGRLSLTPLNMTLGIFNTTTRHSSEAWETIYFHPDSSYMKTFAKSKVEGVHGVENLHRGLDAAFESFRQQCGKKTVFRKLPWNGSIHEVSMKFAVAFVIGDTEQHDKFCCRYQSRSMGTAFVCRHCNCPTMELINSSVQSLTTLWTPDSYRVPHQYETTEANHWRSLSHHNVRNAFYSIDFGSNHHNIHFATPGESLHMLQLGTAKRAVESFARTVSSMPQNNVRRRGDNRTRANRAEAFAQFSKVAVNYGYSLSHQSDRSFPRLRFTSEILNPTKKNGKDYPGIILCTTLALLSKKGKKILNNLALVDNQKINQFVKGFELILLVDSFLQKCELRVQDVTKINDFVITFMDTYKKTFKRGGNGTCLIKNHLFFHLQKYIEMFGPPSGWDSCFPEEHHKEEIKAPSLLTQRNASSIVEQTCRRKMEHQALKRAVTSLVTTHDDIPSNIKPVRHMAGARYELFCDQDGHHAMRWLSQQNQDKSHLPECVTKFCCQTFIPQDDKESILSCFTEHNCHFEGDNASHKFRAHPSFRSESGQASGVWHDWANFLYLDGETVKETPAQILCFLELNDEQAVSGGQAGGGPHAVVRSFQEEPKDFPPSILVKRGVLADDYYVYPCTSISGPVAVVQNQTESELENEFFVVSNKDDWLVKFHEKLETGDETDTNDETDNDGEEFVDQEEDSDSHDGEGIR